MALPAAFEHAAPAGGAGPEPGWPASFGSTELAALIEEAGRDNPDRAAADARWQQALARARAAGAALRPTLSAGATVTPSAGRSGGQTAHETDWSALLAASWEWDLWGRNRATWRSARLQAQASGIERDAVRAATTAGVVSGYFQVLSLRERAALARTDLQAAQAVLAVVEARYAAGATGVVELATQRAAVANAELAIPPLVQAEVEARTALALLLGRAPEGLQIAGESLQGIALQPVAAGLPSDLLQRRPDVVAAELALEAAQADVQAARAALFPTLNLTLAGGLQNPAMQAAVTTLSGTGVGLSLTAALLQSVFDGGRRRAVREEAQAREQELLAGYRRALQTALRDSEDALSSIEQLEARSDAQQRAVAESTRAFTAAEARYRAGAGDYLAMLEAQRTLSGARDQQMQFHLARLMAQVALYQALGGGWQYTRSP